MRALVFFLAALVCSPALADGISIPGLPLSGGTVYGSVAVNNHIGSNGATQPTLSGISGSTLNASASDFHGTVTTTGTGTQLITFAVPYTNPPDCETQGVATAATLAGPRVASTTALSVPITGAGSFSYFCFGQ